MSTSLSLVYVVLNFIHITRITNPCKGSCIILCIWEKTNKKTVVYCIFGYEFILSFDLICHLICGYIVRFSDDLSEYHVSSSVMKLSPLYKFLTYSFFVKFYFMKSISQLLFPLSLECYYYQQFCDLI